MTSNSIARVAACATLLWVGTAQAAVTPQQKCQQAKLKAQGKLKSCLAKNSSGAIVGKTDESAECQTKFITALTKADTKASDAGTKCRYIDNGDGTVSDLNTGLVWEKKDTLAGIHHKDNRYTWADNDSTTPNGTAFTGLLGTLNAGTSFNSTAIVTPCFTGHCDWRLPTMQELRGIVDLSVPGCGSGSPCIDPAFGSTALESYWSAITSVSYPEYGLDLAWTVYSGSGDSYDSNKPTLLAARAVRGGL